jgi:hypothetical protein
VERFIVGTGRCGSTLLSQMFAEHPGALSIFELFNGIDWGRRFAPDPTSGESYGIAAFLDLPEGGDWTQRAARLVRGVPVRRVPELARAERDALDAACRPGQVLLGRA